MQKVNISQFKKSIETYIEDVADNNEPLFVSGFGKTVVIISLEDYNSRNETAYLMSTEANKKMMYKSKDEIENANNF